MLDIDKEDALKIKL